MVEDECDECVEDAIDELVDGRDGGCYGSRGLFQLDLRISTFEDFHSSEFGGKMALGSINEEATINSI